MDKDPPDPHHARSPTTTCARGEQGAKLPAVEASAVACPRISSSQRHDTDEASSSEEETTTEGAWRSGLAVKPRFSMAAKGNKAVAATVLADQVKEEGNEAGHLIGESRSLLSVSFSVLSCSSLVVLRVVTCSKSK